MSYNYGLYIPGDSQKLRSYKTAIVSVSWQDAVNQDIVNVSAPRCSDAEVKEQVGLFPPPPKISPSETRNINDIRMFFF